MKFNGWGNGHFLWMPFVKFGVKESSLNGDSERDWVQAAFGYKHYFPSGLTFESTIDLNIGARYGFPDLNFPLLEK